MPNEPIFGIKKNETLPTAPVGGTNANSTAQVGMQEGLQSRLPEGSVMMLSTPDGPSSSIAPEATPEPTVSQVIGGAGAGVGAGAGAGAGTEATSTSPADTLAQIKNEALSLQQQVNNLSTGDPYSNLAFEDETKPTSSQLTDEEKREIERQQLRLHQAEIDAVNRVYDQLLNEARIEGQGRIGSQRAIAARGGILGSDFAGAQKDKVQAFNTDIRRGIQAERQAKIGAIMGEVRQAVAAEKAAKRAAKQADSETYLDYLKNEPARKQKNAALLAQTLLAQGLNPEELSEEEITEMVQTAGITPDMLMSQYSIMSSQASDAETKTLSPGETLVDTDGNVIFEVPSDQNYKYMSVSGGIMQIDPKTGAREFISAPGAAGSGGVDNIELTTGTRRELLGAGWTQGEISSIENDVRQYGIGAVIEQARQNGANQSQINSLQAAYSGEVTQPEERFINKELFRSFYSDEQLEQDARAAGFMTDTYMPFDEKVHTDQYLDSLMSNVEAWRTAGFSDAEIYDKLR